MRNKILAMLLILLMTCNALPLNNLIADAAVSLNERESIAEQTVISMNIMKRNAKGDMDYTKKVSRADFAQMLIQASSYAGKVSKASDVTLFKDVTKKHNKSGYIKFVVKQGLMSGYLDGSFRPSQAVTLDEAVLAVLQLLGYSSSDFSGVPSNARFEFYKEKELNENISKKKKDKLTRRDCMNLFYNMLTAQNKEGSIYAVTLGYSLDKEGEVDYLKIIEKSLKGPIIAGENWEKSIPFPIKTANVYINNKKSTETKVKEYDVIYYSKTQEAIWVYDDKVQGKLESIKPNRTTPSEVVVTGETYSISNQKTATKVSTQGEFKTGMNIILLIGRDGSVVDIIAPEKINAVLYGTVLDKGEHVSTSTDNLDTVKSYIRMVDTSGVEHEFDCDTSMLYTGNPVQVSFVGGETIVTKLAEQPLYGIVNSDGSKISDTYFSENIRIIDVNGKQYKKVYQAQLADMVLSNLNVSYYAKNKIGEITDLILKNATGETYQYGMLLSSDVTETKVEIPGFGPVIKRTGIYKYDLNGQEYVYSSDNAIWNYDAAPIGFLFEGNEIKDMHRLLRVPLGSIDGGQARAGEAVYEIWDKVAVYLQKDDKYYLSKLSNVSQLNKYSLDGYIEKKADEGGKIRVIIAKSK